MAELTGIGYRPGGSRVHRMDARTKMACLALVTLTAVRATAPALGLLTLLTGSAAVCSRLPLTTAARDLRHSLWLLGAVFAARCVTTTGTPVLDLYLFTVTAEGAASGALFAWRLALIIAAGFLAVATTRPPDTRAAVVWFLKPVPWVPERRVATMISLMVRFIPAILQQARETADAQRARCVESRKRPVRRLAVFSAAVLRHTFERADRLTLAMEARGYTEDRTERRLTTSPSDRAALLLVLSVSGIALLM